MNKTIVFISYCNSVMIVIVRVVCAPNKKAGPTLAPLV